MSGAKSEGEGPISSDEEAISTDRGYTSDTELTRSPKSGAPRPQSPVVAAVTTPVSQATTRSSSGGWILVSNLVLW